MNEELGALSRNELLALQDARRRGSRRCSDLPTVANPWGLTAMQCKVLSMVCDGLLSKQIGPTLGISQKTVEAHRSRAMYKMGAVGNGLRAAILWDRFTRSQAQAKEKP